MRLLIYTCHRRGTFAMGGMAAQIPVKGGGPQAQAALDSVKADKLREVSPLLYRNSKEREMGQIGPLLVKGIGNG